MKGLNEENLLRISDNGKDAYNRPVLIGKYAYTCRQVGVYSVQVMRCKRDDLGREWIGWDGKQHDGWEPYGAPFIPAPKCIRR